MRTALLSLILVAASAYAQEPAPGQNLDVPPNSVSPPPRAAIPAVMATHSEKGLLLGIAKAGEMLVAVGGNGVIVRSADGKSWAQVQSPVDVTLTHVAFADAQRGWAVGHDAIILDTGDGGKTWTVQSAQPDLFSPLFAVQPLGGGRVIAVGAFGLLKLSEDNGKSWRDLIAPEIQQGKFHINTITRLAGGKLLVAGEQGLIGVSDDVVNWKRVESPYEGSYFGALPWGERGVILFGMRGNVYTAADIAAPEWNHRDLGTTDSFYGGEVLDLNRVVLVGAEGRVMLINRDGQAQVLGGSKGAGQSSSLTASTVLGQALVTVGDKGVARFALP